MTRQQRRNKTRKFGKLAAQVIKEGERIEKINNDNRIKEVGKGHDGESSSKEL